MGFLLAPHRWSKVPRQRYTPAPGSGSQLEEKQGAASGTGPGSRGRAYHRDVHHSMVHKVAEGGRDGELLQKRTSARARSRYMFSTPGARLASDGPDRFPAFPWT